MTVQVLGNSVGLRAWLGNSAAILATNLAQAAAPFLSLFLIGRLHGMEEAGRFALAQSLTAPTFQLLGLQLKPLLLSYTAQEVPVGSILPLRLLTSLAGVLLGAGLYIFSGSVSLWLALLRLTDSWIELHHAAWQRQDEPWRPMLTTLARLGVAAITLLTIPKLESALAAQFVLSLFLLWAFEWKQESAIAQIDLQLLARRGFMLGAVLLFVSFQAHIPRVALENWHGPAELGALATLAVLIQGGNLAASAFGQSLLPKLRVASIREVLGFASLLFLAAALIALLLMPLRQSVAAAILGADVPAAGDILWLLSLAQMCSWPAAVIGCALTAKRIDRPQVWMAGALCVFAIPLSYLLIAPWGARGAATICVILSALTLGLSYAALRCGGDAV